MQKIRLKKTNRPGYCFGRPGQALLVPRQFAACPLEAFQAFSCP